MVTACLFLLTLATAVGTYALLVRRMELATRNSALSRLTAAAPAAVSEDASRRRTPLLMAEDAERRAPLAAALLRVLRLKNDAERLAETAGLHWGGAGLMHRCLAAFLAGFAAATVAGRNEMPLAALGCGAVAGWLPLAWARRKAGQRIRAFEEQFPDGLEFISRSMRAGHAFSIAVELACREFADPLGAELRRIFEEQNLGQPLEVVLRKMAARVPSLDVHFFVSAVLLQKRTGGNLSELLDKLAALIRERFKLRGRIRAISAQGLMSGRILAAIPGAVGLIMFLMNREYARFFIDDPAGHRLLAGALGLQFVGYLIIRKIVSIEV